MATSLSFQRLFVGVVGIILLTLVYQAFRALPEARSPTKETGGPCKGDPILVDYAYEWNVIEPHACAPQCQGGRPLYVLYKNGLATQCETPPGCNDSGEDNGVTCTVPVRS